MANRERKYQLKIWLTEEEKQQFVIKMKMTKCRSMREFILRCVLQKQIFEIDMNPFRELRFLLSNATNNLNQITRKINATSEYNRADIQPIKADIHKMTLDLVNIQKIMLAIKEHIK